MTEGKIDLTALAQSVARAARETLCSVCGHSLDRHYKADVTVTNEAGVRQHCIVHGCDCIPTWTQEESEA